MSVRLTGIKTMSFFAHRCQSIRQSCLRFLIDMLNDEIDEVRIGALHGIGNFNRVLTLSDHEVDTVLFNLNEDNLNLRRHIYALFSTTTIPSSNHELLLRLVNRIIANLWKYGATDQDLIFGVMKKMGRRHAEQITKRYHEVLEIDQRYLSKEPYQNDPSYVAKIILIYQAATTLHPEKKLSEILNEAPFYLEKHLNYFKDKYHQYFAAAA